jgi:hypothetical protein
MKEKKAHAEDRTQTSSPSGLTAIFKFSGHPQKLVQNSNWFSMLTITHETINPGIRTHKTVSENRSLPASSIRSCWQS